MSERGSAMPMLAVLVLGGMLVAGLAIDLGRWGVTWREAAFAADTGAEAGAAMLDTEAAYRDDLRLDAGLARAAAIDAALGARPRPGRTATATADASAVCVTVHQQFRPTLLRAAGVRGGVIAVQACAVPGMG